jgi:hypothetical protein
VVIEGKATHSRARRLLESALLILTPLLVVFLAHGAPPMLNWAYAAFMMGMFTELVLLAESPKEAGIIAALPLFLIAFSFLLGRDAISQWPLAYAVTLLIVIIGRFHRELTPRIGEGYALLASLAFLAWMLDRWVSGSGGPIPLAIAVIPVVFTLVLALTSIRLTRATRLVMSLWTGLVVGLLSIRYYQAVVDLGAVEDRIGRGDWGDAISTFLEFLLLGASGLVLARNLMMLLIYLPGRTRFFNQKYREDAAEATREHIARFSTEQVAPPQTVAAVLIAAALLVLQGILHLVPINFVIWSLLAGVPWVMTAWTRWSVAHREQVRTS